MKLLACSLALLAALVASAAEEPVNRNEAATVFARATQVVKGILAIGATPPAYAGGKTVASRESLVKEFYTLYQMVQPKMKVTPPPSLFNPALMTLKDAQARTQAERLATLGFVDKMGPLITGKTEGLSVTEFGDALGYFLSRVADVTHTPSTKFSPALMPP